MLYLRSSSVSLFFSASWTVLRSFFACLSFSFLSLMLSLMLPNWRIWCIKQFRIFSFSSTLKSMTVFTVIAFKIWGSLILNERPASSQTMGLLKIGFALANWRKYSNFQFNTSSLMHFQLCDRLSPKCASAVLQWGWLRQHWVWWWGIPGMFGSSWLQQLLS